MNDDMGDERGFSTTSILTMTQRTSSDRGEGEEDSSQNPLSLSFLNRSMAGVFSKASLSETLSMLHSQFKQRNQSLQQTEKKLKEQNGRTHEILISFSTLQLELHKLLSEGFQISTITLEEVESLSTFRIRSISRLQNVCSLKWGIAFSSPSISRLSLVDHSEVLDSLAELLDKNRSSSLQEMRFATNFSLQGRSPKSQKEKEKASSENFKSEKSDGLPDCLKEIRSRDQEGEQTNETLQAISSQFNHSLYLYNRELAAFQTLVRKVEEVESRMAVFEIKNRLRGKKIDPNPQEERIDNELKRDEESLSSDLLSPTLFHQTDCSDLLENDDRPPTSFERMNGFVGTEMEESFESSLDATGIESLRKTSDSPLHSYEDYPSLESLLPSTKELENPVKDSFIYLNGTNHNHHDTQTQQRIEGDHTMAPFPSTSTTATVGTSTTDTFPDPLWEKGHDFERPQEKSGEIHHDEQFDLMNLLVSFSEYHQFDIEEGTSFENEKRFEERKNKEDDMEKGKNREGDSTGDENDDDDDDLLEDLESEVKEQKIWSDDFREAGKKQQIEGYREEVGNEFQLKERIEERERGDLKVLSDSFSFQSDGKGSHQNHVFGESDAKYYESGNSGDCDFQMKKRGEKRSEDFSPSTSSFPVAQSPPPKSTTTNQSSDAPLSRPPSPRFSHPSPQPNSLVTPGYSQSTPDLSLISSPNVSSKSHSSITLPNHQPHNLHQSASPPFLIAPPSLNSHQNRLLELPYTPIQRKEEGSKESIENDKKFTLQQLLICEEKKETLRQFLERERVVLSSVLDAINLVDPLPAPASTSTSLSQFSSTFQPSPRNRTILQEESSVHSSVLLPFLLPNYHSPSQLLPNHQTPHLSFSDNPIKSPSFRASNHEEQSREQYDLNDFLEGTIGSDDDDEEPFDPKTIILTDRRRAQLPLVRTARRTAHLSSSSLNLLSLTQSDSSSSDLTLSSPSSPPSSPAPSPSNTPSTSTSQISSSSPQHAVSISSTTKLPLPSETEGPPSSQQGESDPSVLGDSPERYPLLTPPIRRKGRSDRVAGKLVDYGSVPNTSLPSRAPLVSRSDDLPTLAKTSTSSPPTKSPPPTHHLVANPQSRPSPPRPLQSPSPHQTTTTTQPPIRSGTGSQNSQPQSTTKISKSQQQRTQQHPETQQQDPQKQKNSPTKADVIAALQRFEELSRSTQKKMEERNRMYEEFHRKLSSARQLFDSETKKGTPEN